MDWNKLADALIPDENVKPLEEYEKINYINAFDRYVFPFCLFQHTEQQH